MTEIRITTKDNQTYTIKETERVEIVRRAIYAQLADKSEWLEVGYLNADKNENFFITQVLFIRKADIKTVTMTG